MKKIILSALLCQLISLYNAQERIDLDRPDQTETSAIVPIHFLQIETGYVYESIDKEKNSQQLPTVLFKYGIAKSTELRIITEFDYDKDFNSKQYTIQPVTIGFKTALIEEKGFLPNISFVGHLTLFSKDDENRIRTIPLFKLLFDHELSENFSIGYNLGMEWDNNLNENYVYTLSLADALSPKFNIFIEAYGSVSPIFKADHRFDTGLTYFINNNSAIDISGGIGLSSASPSYFLSFGYSFRVNLKKKKN